LRREPEPPIEAQVPDPPPFVTGYAADEWHRVVPHLYLMGLLSVLDTMPLAAYCMSYSHWRQAEEALAAVAMTISTAGGSLRAHPLVKVSRDSAADMVKFAGEFGMSPVARSRVAAGVCGQPPGGGKFDGLLSDG
jgi:P27 family predicted phage terminase small subunit